MKPYLLRVDVAPDQSFKVRNNVNPLHYNQWHYHDELELTCIRKGTGIRFVGDHIGNFSEGDLILMGSNLPHFWRSNGQRAASDETPNAIVVQFLPDFWGKNFLELPEMGQVKELFRKAKRGLHLQGETRDVVVQLMERIAGAEGVERIMLLLRILHTIATSHDTVYLSSVGFTASLNEVHAKRISEVCAYTFNNFSRKIKLQEVAAIAHLSPTAFCRYFKSHTHKTYSQFLLEIRVGHACRLLMENNLSIGQVCLDSGFQNFSNFNRYFKTVTKLTPQEYQKLQLKGS